MEFGDIALLLRSFTDVAIYEDAFARAAVPFYTVKGRGFYGCKEVNDLAALLGAIDDPQNPLELAAALRSPLFGLSDQCLLEMALHQHEAERGTEPGNEPRRPRKWWELFNDAGEDFAWLGDEPQGGARRQRRAASLRRMRERASLTAIVERALELTHFEAVLTRSAQRPAARCQRAQADGDRARIRERIASSGLAISCAICAAWSKRQPREPQAQIAGEADNVVRLMTIHQAKGLEFPVVDRRRPGTPATLR